MRKLEEKEKYNIGDHITTKDGKLVIANDKKRLIAYAEKEIEEWQKFIKRLKSEKA